MKYISTAFLALIMLIGCSVLIAAQVKPSEIRKSTGQIEILRDKLIAAIKSRDEKTLQAIYTDDFTHTHASGQVDDKSSRIKTLVAGDLTIESAAVDEIKIRVYNRATAVAVGQSTLRDKNGNSTKYRWTIVYVKTDKIWRIAASQATRIEEK